MTLKEFAQRRGVSETKAREWKRQGKIEQDASGVWRPVASAAPTLEDRIAQLEADNAALLDRVTALESAQPEGSRGILGSKSNYTGSAKSIGEPFHD